MSSGVSLTSGVTGAGLTAQPPTSNSNNTAATTAFVNQQILSTEAYLPLVGVTGGVYNQASLGTGMTFVIFVSSSPGPISSVLSIVTGGTGYAVGDLLLVQGGNYDAVLRVTNVVGGVVQSGGLAVAYAGTGYVTGVTTMAIPGSPGSRTVAMSGALTSNVTFILTAGTFTTASRRPCFCNNTTGAFTVTVLLSNGAGGTTGTGVVCTQGTNNSTAQLLMTDGMTDVWKVA